MQLGFHDTKKCSFCGQFMIILLDRLQIWFINMYIALFLNGMSVAISIILTVIIERKRSDIVIVIISIVFLSYLLFKYR